MGKYKSFALSISSVRTGLRRYRQAQCFGLARILSVSTALNRTLGAPAVDTYTCMLGTISTVNCPSRLPRSLPPARRSPASAGSSAAMELWRSTIRLLSVRRAGNAAEGPWHTLARLPARQRPAGRRRFTADGPLPDDNHRLRRSTRCWSATRARSLACITERILSVCSSRACLSTTPDCVARSAQRRVTSSPSAARMFRIGAAWYDASTSRSASLTRRSRSASNVSIYAADLKHMWSDDNGPYQGKRLAARRDALRAATHPKGGPRSWIVLQRRAEDPEVWVARYADRATSCPWTVDAIPHSSDVLERHCDDDGREPHRDREARIGRRAIPSPTQTLSAQH